MIADDFEADRERLAESLRALRLEAELSTTQLGRLLGWSQSKVSKIELGRTTPAVSDVEVWCRATGAEPDRQRELRPLAERLAHQSNRWRRELSTGRREMQRTVHRLEKAATVVRVFSPDVIVGLAQTRAYAEAMFTMGRDLYGPDARQRVEIVDARLARQAELDDASKQFYFVMGETALHRRLVRAEAFDEQLSRLLTIATMPNVEISVIPFAGPERVHQYHGFAVIGDPDRDAESRVLVETVTRALTIRTTDEVREYVDYFNALRASAVTGADFADLVRRLRSRAH
jgi:transcriptional regulator with XRE-family HTH domain